MIGTFLKIIRSSSEFLKVYIYTVYILYAMYLLPTIKTTIAQDPEVSGFSDLILAILRKFSSPLEKPSIKASLGFSGK